MHQIGRQIGRRAGVTFLCLLLVLGVAFAPLLFDPRSAEAADGGQLVVAIDVGHGSDPDTGAWDPGACANGIVEADANTRIALACANELSSYYGVKVVFTGRYAGTGSLEKRVQSAVDQNADVVISIHCNSAGASAYGSEVWVPNSSAYLYNETHVVGDNLGKSILSQLSGLGFYNRGTFTRDCTVNEYYPYPGGLCDWYGINYWSRWMGIPGIIVEHGFITNWNDAQKLGNASWCESIGVADATGIAQYYGLSKTPPTNPELEKTGESVTTEVVLSYEDDPSIMGTSLTTVDEMVAWYNSKSKTYPADVYAQYGASNVEEFCQMLFEEAEAEGVRAEVAFAQSMVETGWLQFGGMVKAEQCNFCGLGATDNSGGKVVADFSTYGEDGVRMGLRAQMQHLKAYASTDALVNECVDPRFDLVTRGVAPTVKSLTGKWATSAAYGDSLTNGVNGLLGASYAPTGVRISLADVPSSLVSGSNAVVYVDGVARPLVVDGTYGTVEVTGSGAHSIVLYEYNVSSSDVHEVYPTHMYTWIAVRDGDAYVATRYYGFDDLLNYAGSSIRITGNKGIRMITGLSTDAKSMLTNGGICGYTVVETGTLLAWSDRVDAGSLTFDTPGASRGKAYVKGSQNPAFATADGVEYYTNVLVGFNSAEQYKRDMAMRSYAILEDAAGNSFTVYGGTVHRSIVYIAEQNADEFSESTAAYEFVHGIIDACKE